MTNYKSYLKHLDKSQATIKHYDNAKSRFIEWCKQKRIKIEQLHYKQLVNYINTLKPNNKPHSVNTHIIAIKHYLNYLIQQDRITDNIAEDLKVRGTTKTILQNLLSNDELEDLYYSYETKSIKNNFYFKATAKRNKIIVGLLVYQGLISNNFRRLKVDDVNLQRGTIYIESTRRNAARNLQLKPWQMMPLKEYIDEVLPIIRTHTNVYDEHLFPLNTNQFNVLLFPIFNKLKTYNQKVANNNHIRSSVIVNWLKRHNLREVQQMAGHRNINSTEAYKQDDLENLQKVINNFHPLS